MKKILYIFFVLISFNLFFYSARADTEKIASCVYYAENVLNEEAPSKIILNINKDYSINFDYLGYTQNRKECADPTSRSYKSHGCDQLIFDIRYDFQYGDFITDTKFDCNNIQKIYHNNDLDVAHLTIKYIFNKSQYDGLEGVYILNKEESIVEVENPTKMEDEEGWLKVCHYNNVVLKFNTTKYELISDYPLKKGYPLEEGNLMKYLADNKYSCPSKYCYYDGHGSQDIEGNSVYSKLGYFINNERDYTPGKTCYFSADYSGEEFVCGGILLYMKEFDQYNEKYKATKEINYISLRNKSEQKIKEFCRTVLSNSNYNEPNNCANECISIDKVITNRLGKDTSSNKKEYCGFSQKLALYIRNIVKWVKYIIPVIVIVLGILDFIKAIAADKEDEMKKAQGHFVKRLIAAALIFIVPLIIGFVLDKMGFEEYVSGCEIIDL